MKKILPIFVISALAASTALADAHYNHYNNYNKPKNATSTQPNKALAQNDKDDYYLRADAGASFPRRVSDKHTYFSCKAKDTAVVNIGFGKSFSKHIRSDITASYREYKINSNRNVSGINFNSRQNIKSTNVMLNGYYDMLTLASLTPYLSAGVGAAYNDGNTLTVTSTASTTSTFGGKNNVSAAWQVGGGISANMNKNFDLDLSYKFLDLGKVKTKTGIQTGGGQGQATAQAGNAKLRANEVMLGIRYSF